jgi:hypothetical protein
MEYRMLKLVRLKTLAVSSSENARWGGIREACKITGIGRTRLYQLVDDANGKIRTCSLKRPGAVKGRRLIHPPSLLDYLEELAVKQQEVVS